MRIRFVDYLQVIIYILVSSFIVTVFRAPRNELLNIKYILIIMFQAEIHRLQEANKLANKERQLMLKQHEQMTKKIVTKQVSLLVGLLS